MISTRRSLAGLDGRKRLKENLADRELAFHIVDVFAESSYAGNQLSVVKDVGNLSTKEMQKIAREFNFSETTFISSPEVIAAKPSKVRIFTPNHELPFAGHPTLGTAWVIQRYIIRKRVPKVLLDLKVGEIPVSFTYKRNGEPDILWMKQNEPKFGRKDFKRYQLAEILGVNTDCIDERFPIQEVSTGIYMLIVPLKTIKALKKCSINRDRYYALVNRTEAKSILVFCPEPYNKTSDLSVRVFPEYYGIREDPATGSGNGCLAAYLSKYKYFGKSSFNKTSDQGYEIGRPSKLFLKIKSNNGKIQVYIGGRVANVGEGKLFV
jgi:trans-2,3-dihydro-3-hydroxyanthranilate isomerase